MDRRFALFAVLVALIFVVNQIVFSLLFPPAPPKKKQADKQVAAAQEKEGDEQDQADEDAKGDVPQGDIQAAPQEPADVDQPDAEPGAQDAKDKPDAAKEQPAEQPPVPPARGTLGSADHDSPFRMLVVWNNRGASIEAIELNSPHYRELDNRSGYLGYLAPLDAPARGGAIVRVVGDGTAAAAAGLAVDDVITAIGQTPIKNVAGLDEALLATRPGQTIELTVRRDHGDEKLTATLRHRPLALIRPEYDTEGVGQVKPGDHDPFSFLTTIRSFDERALPDDDKNKELGGVHLRDGTWEVVRADTDVVQFKQVLPKLGLEVTKTFTLERVPDHELANPNYPAYGLKFNLRIANIGDDPHDIAYRLDGPNGLPTEGAWYASKVSHTWSTAGLRDVIVQFNGGRLDQVSPALLADPENNLGWGDTASLDYIAVDAQYFSAAIIPRKNDPGAILFERVLPTRAGAIPKESRDVRLMNVSFRLDSQPTKLAPGGAPLEHEFQIFAGPKRPALLAQYGQPGGSLGDLVYYGWFGVVARPMLSVLHFFYSIVGNYGLAIILLTVVVRGCMFPLSRKQVLGAQKMQELQPEMKRISEKYKNEPEKRTKATQELFRQHNYNPVGGCLLMFVQLPVFMGLYRSLMVDVELRQAPLISESVRWASNLSAPDMLWNWTRVVPDFVVHGAGIFPALGPYLNILPLATVGLFIWQQKMFMPPPADEQAAMQQKMMKYMMLFMGVLFFKVASGLCVYFIASSLWGVTERKLLPKPVAKGPEGGGTAGTPVKAAAPSPTGNGAPASKKKKRQRGRR